MEQPFLKIGNYTINPSAIAYINWDEPYTDEPTISIYLQYPNEQERAISFLKDSPEGKAVRKYFDSGMQHVDLVLIFGESQ